MAVTTEVRNTDVVTPNDEDVRLLCSFRHFLGHCLFLHVRTSFALRSGAEGGSAAVGGLSGRALANRSLIATDAKIGHVFPAAEQLGSFRELLGELELGLVFVRLLRLSKQGCRRRLETS